MRAEACEQVPAKWNILPISSVCTRITSGGTPSRNHPEYYINGTWPWVKSKELLDNWIRDTEEHITDEAIENSAANVLPDGTILVALYGATVGQLGVTEREMTCNQACAALQVDESKADTGYLFYQLLHHRSQLKRSATGAAQQNISVGFLKDLCLPFPSIEEQRSIGSFLSAIDRKIEVNMSVNEILESVARTVFKSWFVDFDPVRANAEGRKPVGIDDYTEGIFPDSFVDSELGEIPDGWEVIKISDGIRIMGGSTPRTDNPEFWGGNIYFAGPKNMSESQGPILHSTSRKITEKGAGKISSGIIAEGAVLLSSRAPIGYVAITCVPLAVNQGIIAMGCNGNLANHYVYFWTKHYMDHIKSLASGTTFAEIRKSDFKTLSILKPPQDVMRRFEGLVSPIFELIRANILQSETLSEIKDALLPNLMTGKIRIDNGLPLRC